MWPIECEITFITRITLEMTQHRTSREPGYVTLWRSKSCVCVFDSVLSPSWVVPRQGEQAADSSSSSPAQLCSQALWNLSMNTQTQPQSACIYPQRYKEGEMEGGEWEACYRSERRKKTVGRVNGLEKERKIQCEEEEE